MERRLTVGFKVRTLSVAIKHAENPYSEPNKEQ